MRRLVMKKLLAIIVLFASIEMTVAVAQPSCAGGQIVTHTFGYAWNGECCEVEIQACVKPAPNASISILSIKMNGDCWGTIDPNTFPYALVAKMGYEKIVLRYASTAILNIGVLRQCPDVTTYTVETKIGGCGLYLQYQVPVGNPDGSQSLKTVREYTVCTYETCARTCSVCVLQSTDPCNENEPRLFWACEGNVSAPQCPTTVCKYPMCPGLP